MLFREAIDRLSMKELLQESSHSWLETGQRQDQIFALFGLATDTQELEVKVDYTVPWEDVYTQLAVAYLKRNDLWFLSYCQNTVAERSSSLPSWVPDWSVGYRGHPIAFHFATPSNHSASFDIESQPGLQGVSPHHRLQLKGIVVDQVDWVSAPRPPASVNDLSQDTRNRIFRWMSSIVSNLSSRSQREIWTVLIAGSRNLPLPQEYHGDLIEEEKRKLIDTAFGSLMKRDKATDAKVQGIVECYRRCMMQATAWRCVFRTEKGLIGLGPAGMKERDSVVVFLGAETPFVIRLCDLSSPSYRIVGETYVYGQMEGESFRDNPVAKDIILE